MYHIYPYIYPYLIVIYSLEFYFRPSLKSLYSNGSPMDPRLDYLKWLISAMPGAEISRIEGRGRVNVSNVLGFPWFSMSWEQPCSEIYTYT